MSNKITKQEAVAFLTERDNFLIFTHNSADADTVGSAIALVIALRTLGKKAVAFNREGIPARLAFLKPEDYFVSDLPDTAEHTLVSVDVASPKMLSMPESAYTFALSIDHHEINTIGCERLFVCEDYIAAGEIIHEIIGALGVELTQETALPLYAAICSDSGGFRYQATRPETMRTAASLMETGIDHARINRLLFESKTPVEIAVERLGYQKLSMHFDNRFAMVAVTAEELRSVGASDSDTEVLNQIPRQIAGVQASAVIRPKGDIIKCSLRSNEDINVAALAQTWNGGGHFHAAGFSMKNVTTEQMQKLLLDKIGDLLL